jgi:hypothetical protein
MILGFVMPSCDMTKNQARSDEVRTIWSTLPIYPGMVEVEGGSIMAGFDKAYISKHFKSPSRYQDVKTFYENDLNKKGWHLTNERELKTFSGELSGAMEIEFRKGEYELVIDYAPENMDYGWNYGISVGWFLRVR